MKRLYLITPFLFTLAFVLYINYWTLTIVSPNQPIRLLAALWLLLGLLVYPAYRLTHSLEWASVLLTVFVFGFYFSQTFFEIVASMIFAGIILWQSYFRLRGFKVEFHQLFMLLNSIAICIIGFSLYLNIRSFVQVPWSTYLKSVIQASNYSIDALSTPAVKPDIYYIVLDGYPRSDILKDFYGYDNSEFTTYLQESGFIIPNNIHSNYARTAVSISSTLNMDYVSSFAPGLEDNHFWWLMVPFIDHNRARAVLEAQGYKAISLSTWSVTDQMTSIYSHAFPIMLTDFERYFLAITPLGYIQPLIKNIASIPTYVTHQRVVIYSFDSLQQIPEVAGPKFVFAHITIPHPPFVFDQDGKPLKLSGQFNMNDAEEFPGSRIEYQDGYVSQIKFVNHQMQLVIDAILKKSKTPPIIIIQADHGSALLTDFSSAENTCIKERFSPFAAYYLPGMDSSVIPSNITSVNVFRIIFNQYFQASLPLLENKQYFYKDKVYIYHMVDVTSRIDEECTIH